MQNKLGDIRKMCKEPHVWGMWDGAFWSRVEWIPDKGWLIPTEMVERLGWYDERHKRES
jgi:hypothetical protein